CGRRTRCSPARAWSPPPAWSRSPISRAPRALKSRLALPARPCLSHRLPVPRSRMRLAGSPRAAGTPQTALWRTPRRAPACRRCSTHGRRGWSGAAPSATERLAQRDEGLQPRQLVLRELVARRVQAALRFQEREEISGAALVAQAGALEGALALRETPLLELAFSLEVLQRAERVLDINQCRDDRRPINRQQLALPRRCFVALRLQTAMLEDGLRQVRTQLEGRTDTGDREHDRRQGWILHARGASESERWEHRCAGGSDIRTASPQTRFRCGHI